MMKKLEQISLEYFVEWGGVAWCALVAEALTFLQSNNKLCDNDILEIGTRYGKMATLFSLLGARVVGIDTSVTALGDAEREAQHWKASNVKFLHYNGDLKIFPDNSFDVVFTKSVLVVVPNLDEFLAQISRILRQNGKIVFLENGAGNILSRLLRAIRFWRKYCHVKYFSTQQIAILRKYFNTEVLKETTFPPVYLIMGSRK